MALAGCASDDSPTRWYLVATDTEPGYGDFDYIAGGPWDSEIPCVAKKEPLQKRVDAGSIYLGTGEFHCERMTHNEASQYDRYIPPPLPTPT